MRWTLRALAVAASLVAACGTGDPSSPPASGTAATGAASDAAVPVSTVSTPPFPGPTSSPPPAAPPAVDAAADTSIPSCRATGEQVVMIGDSYLALTGEVTAQLLRYARGAGTLGQSESYRTYYVSGTQLSGGLISPNIPAQFQEALTAGADIRYVIMDGGGNDVLVGNSGCITTEPPPANASCVQTVADAVTAATALFQKMQSAGVQKIVYFFYPHLPTAGKPYVNDTLDYAYPLVKAVCDASPVPCYFVDTRPSFEGHPEYIGPDGIHPAAAGSDVIATLLWETMQAECIAQ